MRILSVSAFALLSSVASVAAADLGRPAEQPNRFAKTERPPNDIVLEVGGGAEYRPAYEGASDYRFTGVPIVTLHYLWLPGIGEVKGTDLRRDGFAIGPSFRYVRERDSNDYDKIRGLNNVDAAFELGGKFIYTFGMFRAHASLRRGVGGHEGFVGEAGLDLTFNPTAVTEISFGPRMSYADAEYMRTYLGVTPQESLSSGLAAYAPGGGIKGAGAEVNGRYQFTPQWALLGSLSYERLVGEAADSPIAQVGSVDQFSGKLGLTYQFGMNLFR